MRSRSTLAFIGVALAVALVMAVAFSPFASSSPDGLEKVADDKKFLENGRLAGIQEDAPIPDYTFPGVGGERAPTAVAGLAGTLIVFVLGAGLAYVVRSRRRRDGPGAASPGAGAASPGPG